MFYSKQTEAMKDKYKSYLRSVGALSRLSSESIAPYLHYRAAENIFCEAFDAENLSRSDVSADAKKANIGIGLKTFLHGKGNTFQKVAEFNAISGKFDTYSIEQIITLVAESRNKRIDTTQIQYGLTEMIYHCVTRDTNVNYFYEFNMDKVDLAYLNIKEKTRNSIKFTDNVNEYSFNTSKNTLYKRFNCENLLDKVDIEIIDSPFEILASLDKKMFLKTTNEGLNREMIYLPLYAPSSPYMEPAEKSGLNQWNASGRSRHPNEVYIPVPAWIHKKFPSFFPNTNDVSFDLILPDGNVLSASMCQQGQKGLMSNPNKALGKWLLRDVLRLPEGMLLTREILNMINIDSAVIQKVDYLKYKIDFASIGMFEKFKEMQGR